MTESALTPADLRLLAAAGGAAPSLHNSQPWRFRPTPDGSGVEVHADPARAVPLADANGSALYVGVGAALFNLRVAAVRLGRDPVVRLLPDPADPHLLAVLDLAGPAAAAVPAAPGAADTAGVAAGAAAVPFGRDLYPAITERHSSRQPFTNRDVPEAVLAELVAGARAEGVAFAALEEAGVRQVLELTAEAEDRIAHDPARRAETRSWLRPDPAPGSADPAVDGIPYSALGPQDHDARVPMREFAGRPPYQDGPPQPSQRFEALPQLCTLTTPGDGPADWLRAGQALERVWLLATVHGLRLTVWHQPVEWPDLRWGLRDPAEGPGHVQLVMRIGYGPPGAATPRRPLEDILDTPTG
ncbi:Acg family FMN-binding oxidoreductase [Kitasatospora sp. NBC_00458]|uniref:Acg family FMN-binding oxidoreductase n=1 Tax=Kitasatospora sp. NBC_00458 TaxID=2903568 RepID=UPI002E17B64A